MSQLDQIGTEMNSLFKEISSRSWVQYTTGFDLGLTEAENKLKDFKKNAEVFKQIADALSKETNAAEKRKAQILYNSFKDYHLSDKVRKIKDEIDVLENSLIDVINKYRRQMDGKEMTSVEVSEIISQSPDRSLRQKAYESSLPLNQLMVDKGFLKLIQLRHELAVAAGSNNFVDYMLGYEELNSGIFKNWPEITSQRVQKYQQKSKKLAQDYLGLENLMPWDEKYLKSKVCALENKEVDMTQVIQLLSKSFLKFGFDTQKMNLTYDIFPRKNKSEWGYNFTIDMGIDSRILANVSNRFSEYWVLMHETAHGAHYMGLNPDETVYNWGVSGIVAEGFANFMGGQSYSKEFLSEVFKKEDLDHAIAEFKKLSTVTHFQNYRILSALLFDHQLYSKNLTTADDIQNLRQDLEKQVLGESGHEIPWAQLIHHTSHPIYLHNYFLGDVMGENMKKEFTRRHPQNNPDDFPLEFGQFWKTELLDPSGKKPFLDLYKDVLGEEVSIMEYVDGKCLG